MAKDVIKVKDFDRRSSSWIIWVGLNSNDKCPHKDILMRVRQREMWQSEEKEAV